MNLTYSIEDESFAVNIYMVNNPVPIMYQPYWPNGEPWSNRQQAENWAQLCILSIIDADAPYAPAGPGLSGEPKIS